jgi:hypothetical protein
MSGVMLLIISEWGGGDKMNFDLYLPHVFFGVDPYVMLLSVGWSFVKIGARKVVVLSYGCK